MTAALYETKIDGLESVESFPNGTNVEVTFRMPRQLRAITYLGTVAARPEEKAEQSVVTNKFGGEHIIPVAATYTIKTAVKLFHEYADTGDGQELLETVQSHYAADLIFDPNNPAFSIVAVETDVPMPRQAA